MFAYNPSRLNIGSIGRLKNKISGLVSPMYVVFSINKSLVDVKYFEYFIKSPKIINKIDSLKEEGGQDLDLIIIVGIGLIFHSHP